MKSFIKVVEIWIPSKNGMELELADSLFGKYKKFFNASKKTRFAYGEGLPGRAWASAQPCLITDLEKSYFLRKEEAKDIGITAAVAIPIFSGEFLLSVMVLLCGDRRENAGAIELWSNDGKNESTKLSLSAGYYGSLKKLQQVSQRTHFGKGEGLPGSVLDYHIPMLVDDMVNTTLFQRGGNAIVEGVTTAVAFPFTNFTGKDVILTFLSSKATPIARRFEIWLPDREHKSLTLHAAKCDQIEEYVKQRKQERVEKGQGMLGRTWIMGRPLISRDLLKDELSSEELMCDLERGFTLPIVEDGVLKSVVAFLF